MQRQGLLSALAFSCGWSMAVASTCHNGGGFTKAEWPHCFQPTNKDIQVYSGKTADGNFMKLGMHVAGHTGVWTSLALAGNGGMKGANEFVVRKEGDKWVVEDRYSQAYSMPILRSVQNARLMFAKEANGAISWGVLLPMNGCNPVENGFETNYPLSEDYDRWMLWAIGSSHTFGYHAKRGQLHANLLSGPATVPSTAGAVEVDVRMPNVDVKTVNQAGSSNDAKNPYKCGIIDLEMVAKRNMTLKHHVVKFAPLLDPKSEKYVHHMILYGCHVSQGFSSSMQKHGHIIDNCESMPRGCSDFKWPWAVGSEDVVLPAGVGLPFGEGQRWLALQMHYYNPSGAQGVKDSSGVKMFFSPALRTHDAAYYQLNGGTSPVKKKRRLASRYPLPIAKLAHKIEFFVPNHCTSSWSQPINIVGVVHHAHLKGTAIMIDVLRGGKYLNVLRRENQYDFQHQSLDQTIPKTLLPGDELKMTCTYNTNSAKAPVGFGDLTQTEMCYAAALYYPKSSGAGGGAQYRTDQVKEHSTEQGATAFNVQAADRLTEMKRLCSKPGASAEFTNVSKCAEEWMLRPFLFINPDTLKTQYAPLLTHKYICENPIPGFTANGGDVNKYFPGLCPSCYRTKSCTTKALMDSAYVKAYCPSSCHGFDLSLYPDTSRTQGAVPTEVTHCGIDEKWFTPAKYTIPTCSKQGDLSSAAAVALLSGTAPAKKTVAGSFSVKMSPDHAAALTNDPKAKQAFSKAFASTIGLTAADVTIKAIYIDGTKVARRMAEFSVPRRLADSVVKVDYEVKTTKVITTFTASDLSKLRTNIQSEAKAIGQTVQITAVPTATAPVTTTITGSSSGVAPVSSAKYAVISFLLVAALGVSLEM